MNNLNSVLLEGEVVDSPVYQTTPTGTALVRFELSNARYYRGDHNLEKEVSVFEIGAFGKVAEALKDVEKGRALRLVGRLRTDRWTDLEGKMHSKIVIVAEHVELKPARTKEAVMISGGEYSPPISPDEPTPGELF